MKVETGKMIDQDEIARLAGVSQSTVSLVFNGKTTVAEKTRQRVLEVARMAGYHPNMNIEARRLASRRSKTPPQFKNIGLVWSVNYGEFLHNSFFRMIFEGILAEGFRSKVSISHLRILPGGPAKGFNMGG